MKASNVKLKVVEGASAAALETAYETWRAALKDQVFVGKDVALISGSYVAFLWYTE